MVAKTAPYFATTCKRSCFFVFSQKIFNFSKKFLIYPLKNVIPIATKWEGYS